MGQGVTDYTLCSVGFFSYLIEEHDYIFLFHLTERIAVLIASVIFVASYLKGIISDACFE